MRARWIIEVRPRGSRRWGYTAVGSGAYSKRDAAIHVDRLRAAAWQGEVYRVVRYVPAAKKPAKGRR